MAFVARISTAIDNIIRRTNDVKVCQNHFKLTATILTRLRRNLNEIDTTIDRSRSEEDIAQTLKAIDEVVINCSENEASLNGMTYRDLESLLLRLQLRLVQHEADLTDDYEAKVQILSNDYQEQQLLVQTASDETIRQRLEETEGRTIEQLRLLREKYTGTIESYLRGCIELHKSVPLTGLTSDIVAKIAHTLYNISSEDQIKLKRNWQASELPITRTFIQFKSDKSTAFERNESRRFLVRPEDNLFQDSHREKETSKSTWHRLVSTPYMISAAERNRRVPEEDVSEENIIRTKRWVLILGDSGSGKTTFARQLVRHLAQTLLINEQHSTDHGPIRIPVLIRIREFAEILKEQPSLTLFDYIGKHKWMGKSIADGSSSSLDDLSSALQDYIKQGQALIILDGLDEIPGSDQRSKMINVVENFVETYVQTPTGASVFDNPHLNRLLDDPSKLGGNQLIVTSRTVSYHAAPLAGQFAPYTIRSMNTEHVKDFVDYWFINVHQQILDIIRSPISNQGKNHAEALKKELEKTENVGLLDMASNSCLLSFICTISFRQLDGLPLPVQRIRLYEQIINSMLSLWNSKGPTIHISKLVRILSDIAAYIHDNSSSNSISEDEIKEVCIQSIKASFGKTFLTEEDIQDINTQASDFVRIICDDVGILDARGELRYGFLHLSFQEYFTGLKFIDTGKSKQKKFVTDGFDREKEIQLIAQSLRRRTNDPRFRVPIALALGKISSTWSQADFDDCCYEFIQEQDKSDSLLPVGAYTLISCSNDFVNYPSDDILFDAMNRLMIAAGQNKWSLVCPSLLDQITIAMRKFHNGMVPRWVNNFLSQSSSRDILTILAVCHLIEGKPHEFENIQWLDQSSCSMLQSLASVDNENNEFTIDRLLIKIAFSDHQLLLSNPTTFKGFLLGDEIEFNSIPLILFPLMIALYGGLKRNDQTIIFDPSHIHRESSAVTPILVRFLSVKDRAKQDLNLKKLKQECIKSLLTRIDSHDESSETVDLCIASMCLYGIEYVQENLTIIPTSVLRKTMNRLKYISMILRQFYFTGDEDDRSMENEATKFISIAIQKFQYGESARMQFLDLLNSLRSGVARLRSSATSTLLEGESQVYKRLTLHLPNSLRKEDKFLNALLSADTRFSSNQKSCSILHDFTKLFWILENNDDLNTQYRIGVAMDTIPDYLVFRNDEDLLCSVTSVPPHLQNLYLRLLKQKMIIINSNDLTGNNRHHLYFGHILTECLILLSNASCKRISILVALMTLMPWLRIHQLETFGSSLLWTLGLKHSGLFATVEIQKQRTMNFETGQYTDTDENIFGTTDVTDEHQRALIGSYIEQEYKRLQNALTDNRERNMKLYSASVSLAHVCRWTEQERRLSLLTESVRGAMSITNTLIRLDALCVISFSSHLIYNQIQVGTGRSLQEEIEHQFNEIFPPLPLLLHAAIFIRCLPLLQHQQAFDNCLQNLFDKFGDTDKRDQQAVNEALLPYIQSKYIFSSITKWVLHSSLNDNRTIHNTSSALKKYFNIGTDESLSSSLFISNLFLVGLSNDFHECVKTDDDKFAIEELSSTKPFQFESSILTEAQALTMTNVLFFIASAERSESLEKLCVILNNALHCVSLVEFKACHLLESWMKWKDSEQLSSFAYHAALLLVNSDSWSVDSATIVCDLLCCDNDRFRQRAEIILRSSSEHEVRTSSKLGIDVLLSLAKKRAHYQFTSASAKHILSQLFGNIILDIQSHLETFLWLERYRIHALGNKEYSLNKPTSFSNSYIASYFSTGTMLETCSCVNLFRISGDLIIYMCDMIASNFFSFLDIDGDTTSNAVMQSHARFVVSAIVTLGNLLIHNDDTRQVAVEALTNLFDMSNNDEIRRAVAYTLGYVCDEKTYKTLFEKVQIAVTSDGNDTSNMINHVSSALISSYCFCVSINKIAFDQDDMDLFCSVLHHPSQVILKAVRTGFGRVLNDKAFLLEMLGSDIIQCYHALIGSTAYLFLYNVQQTSEDAIVEYIEEHSALLSIFVVELYNSIRHFTNSVSPIGTTDYDLAYGYPSYVKIASLIAIKMPVAFCAFITDWHDGDNLKRALFYTSKQHNYPQRAACLVILSIFGELTVELCQMFIDATHDHPYIQNTCYKCLTRITFIKDEKIVLNVLFSYLKSKSMTVRYLVAKILLHLSKSSIISSSQVQTALNDLMLDSSSNEDLWLIEKQDNMNAYCLYFDAGPLKDVIYSLLVQHLTGDTSGTVERNELHDIDVDFIKSEKASRFASCLYEANIEEKIEIQVPSTPSHHTVTNGNSTLDDTFLSSLSENESD